jgi:hypothetical protein
VARQGDKGAGGDAPPAPESFLHDDQGARMLVKRRTEVRLLRDYVSFKFSYKRGDTVEVSIQDAFFGTVLGFAEATNSDERRMLRDPEAQELKELLARLSRGGAWFT